MDKCTIFNKDSRKLANYIKNETIDFIVFSPPYWNLRDYKFENQIGYKQEYQDYLKDMQKVFCECFKVLKKGRFMAINIGTVVSNDGMKFIAGDFVQRCIKSGFTFRKDIIWHKPRGTTKWQRGATQFSQNPYPLMFNTNINHEYILIFQKGETQEIDNDKIQAFNKDFIRKMAYSVWDIIPVNSPKKDEKHAAPYPEELPRRLIQLFTFKGDIVLDPFAGSGTTCKIAKQLGRRSIAVELSKKYCQLIEKKVQNVEFNSFDDSQIYEGSIDLRLKEQTKKIEQLNKELKKAKKEYRKIIQEKQRKQGGLKKYL